MLRPVLSALSCCIAFTAAAQPVLKAPFGCAQTWDAWTYDSHNDIDSLDFAYWKDRTQKNDPKNQNITLGQFVRASGAGTISKDDLLPDDDWGLVRRVTIDHADGWQTVYLHNRIEPELFEVGRKVALGEVIGLAGRSGTGPTSWHIHYSQKDGDEIVRSQFDRVCVQTHGGNPDMIGLGGSDQAERIRSSNCLGHSFPRWRDGGQTYIFRYNPDKGQARITRIGEGGSEPVNTWSNAEGAWSKSFTDFVTYRVDEVEHLLRYNARNGRATAYRIKTDGAGLDRVSDTRDWRRGWTLLQRVRHEDLNFIFAYDSRTGYRQFLQASPDGTSFAVDESAHDIKGWTHVLGFDRGGNQFLLFYKAATGRMIIRRMDRVTLLNDAGQPTERIRIELADLFDDQRNPGWTHLQLMRQDRVLYMVGFRATGGRTAVWRIGPPSEGPEKTATINLNRKWDIMTSLRTDDHPQVLMYGTDAGDTRLFNLKSDGTGLEGLDPLNWAGGWR